ncbi:MAG: hypothetical protein IPQ08_05085 [Chitinophagaceae bacterium]|nr:hypothetical protein [Chitinophagaceae bacterium]
MIFHLTKLSFLVFFLTYHKAYCQNWTDNKIIYVDNTTIESADPLTVIIEFKYAKCLEINLGKKETISTGKSYYRLVSNLSKTGCKISAKFDYLNCSGKTETSKIFLSLDAKETLESANNNFEGYLVNKIYDIVVTDCNESQPPATEKDNSQNKSINYLEPRDPNNLKSDEFYFFGQINVPTNKGVLQIFTVPIYHGGNTMDELKSDELRSRILSFNSESLNEIIKDEAKRMLDIELKPQGKIVSEIEIKKRTEEIKNLIINNPDEYVTAWIKTPNHDYIAKSLKQSQNQIDEIISVMQNTVNNMQNKSSPENSSIGDFDKQYNYRYKILGKPKFTKRNRSGTYDDGRRG